MHGSRYNCVLRLTLLANGGIVIKSDYVHMSLLFRASAGNLPFHQTHQELSDGENYKVTHTTTPAAARAIENGRATEVTELIMANGSFTGRAVLAPLVEGMVRLAANANHPLEVTTYDDPLTGSNAYGQSYRIERYLHVLDHIRSHRGLDTDHPVSLAGQSRGWLTVMGAVMDRHKQERLGTVTGLAPVGHTPRDIQINVHDVMRVLGMTWGELTDPRADQHDRHALAVKANIAKNAIVHTLGNGAHHRNPLSALHDALWPFMQEVQEILTTDITKDVVTASGTLGQALTLAPCRYDRYAPGEKIVSRFGALPEFAGRVVLLDVPHNGSLLDQHLVPELYGIMLPTVPAQRSA